MKKLFTFIFAILLSCNAFSLTYTTINDGNWNDLTNVWSTDGVTPCNCSPNAIINNDTIIIQHNIIPTSHLTLNNNATVLKVLSGGSLMNINFKLIVKKGKIISNGTIETKELNIESLGKIELNSSVLNIQSRILCEGQFISTFSNIYIALGNIDVGTSGSFTIGTNTKIYFISGNFESFGNVSICNDCCLHLTAGNVQNNLGGTFNGSGSIITDNGNIKNTGSWDALLNWCAAGVASGLSTPENCTTANANCNFAPLPTELVSFNILSEKGSNLLSWFTFSERDGAYYRIERSKDGNLWEELSRINVSNTDIPAMHYMYMDDQPIPGVSYYTISLISINGKLIFSATLGVNTDQLNEVSVFPNPTTDHITVRFARPLDWVKISITDANGIISEIYEGKDVLQETIHLPYPCGLYFVSIQSENLDQTLKVIKR